VVGHLYVGGTGMWQFHRLRSDANRPSELRTVRIASKGLTASEIAAGFAIATDTNGALAKLDELLGHAWAGEDLELDGRALAVLADLVADLDVAMVLTALDGGDDTFAGMAGHPWSVVLAAPTGADARRTQWDGVEDLSAKTWGAR
jgi:hypothetical protein